MNYPKLDNRLSSALRYIRKDNVLADVGTDHAYLPIYAVGTGLSRFAVASDINEGPVMRANLHVKAYSLSDKIAVVQTDGLVGLEKYEPQDIVIFGMGAELISKIISNAPWLRRPECRLILSPMTQPQILRGFLSKNGFAIEEETLSESDGRIYQTLCCSFDGIVSDPSFAELLFGKYNMEHNVKNPLFLEHLTRTGQAFEERVSGKTLAGIDTEYEKEILSEIEKLKS